MDAQLVANALTGGASRGRSKRASRGRSKRASSKHCPPGQILRRGYSATRKSTGRKYHVPSTCIEDRGEPGKGPKIIPPLKKGALSKFGYDTHEGVQKRRMALKKSVLNVGYAETIRRLNAVAILNKNTNPELSRMFKRDMKWVQENLAQYSKSRSRSRSKKSRGRSKSRSRKSRRSRGRHHY